MKTKGWMGGKLDKKTGSSCLQLWVVKDNESQGPKGKQANLEALTQKYYLGRLPNVCLKEGH